MPTYKVPRLRRQPCTAAGPKRVVIATNAAADSLEYIGLLQVFAEVRFFLREAGYPQAYTVEIVSRGTGQIYACQGLSISATTGYADLEGPVDTLIFQAADDRDECLLDSEFIAWVARMSKQVRRIVSVCTGAFILAEAKVLDGRQATTHWAAAQDFRSRYPNVRLTEDRIFVKDGHVYTSGGATAGMDLAIALVEEDLGAELARKVAQAMVVFFRRPGDQAQFNAAPNPDHDEARLHPIESHIRKIWTRIFGLRPLRGSSATACAASIARFQSYSACLRASSSSNAVLTMRATCSKKQTNPSHVLLPNVATPRLKGCIWPSTGVSVSVHEIIETVSAKTCGQLIGVETSIGFATTFD